MAVHEAQSTVAGSPEVSGRISVRCVRIGLLPQADQQPSAGELVSLFREPDAVTPHVRFDEREQETERNQTGPRRHSESHDNKPPGDYRHCANVIQQQGGVGLDKTTKFAWGNKLVHNSYTWTWAVEHSGEHYGQLVGYYRANNLLPPDSRR